MKWKVVGNLYVLKIRLIASSFFFYYFLLVIILISYTANGQSSFSNHYYFPNKFISSQSILQNNDGTYLLVGMADTSVAGAYNVSGFPDFWFNNTEPFN